MGTGAGALTTAGVFALMGSVVPGVGTAVGFAVGAAVSYGATKWMQNEWEE